MQAPSKIRVLSDQTINKIAAGEVIENPASVVKELVENSLDAGAEAICVEIQEGGRQLIRITDDGCGMAPDDALLALERHATSKISSVEDIEELFTMGFRGEAIPSIAAISKFKLLTAPRTREGISEDGSLIMVEGGRLLSHSSAARSPGTTIEVKTLFFNVPVRRKFQKSPAFDAQEILKILGLLALAHPTVQFELISDQKLVLKTPFNSAELSFHDQLEKRLESILGKEFSEKLISLNFRQGPYEVIGFTGSPSIHKPNRTGQYLFINQRPVFSPLIASSVREGYGTMLPTQRYPLFVLHLRMPGSLLDVNVHPQKKEVRIRQEFQLKEAIIQSIQTALRREQKEIPPLQKDEISSSPPPFWGAPPPRFKVPQDPQEKWMYHSSPIPGDEYSEIFYPSEFAQTGSELSLSVMEHSYPINKDSPSSNGATHLLFPSLQPKSAETMSFPLQPTVPTVVATLSGYCILDPFQFPAQWKEISKKKGGGGLPLLDQRAAYSRIHYEKLLKNSGSQESQTLLLPLSLQLSSEEFQLLGEYAPLLNQMGFGLREFGEKTFLVDASPSFIKQEHLQNCLHLLIQDLVEMQTSRQVQIHKEEKLALAACRASLPAAKQLSLEEAQGLIQQLFLCESPWQCPMGKPTCIYLAPEEIAKWFK